MCQLSDKIDIFGRITIKHRLTGKSRLIFQLWIISSQLSLLPCLRKPEYSRQDLTHTLNNCVYTTKQMFRLGKVKNLPHVIRCISFTQFKLSTILHHIFFSHFINNY